MTYRANALAWVHLLVRFGFMVATYAVLSPAGVRHAVTFRCLGQAIAEVDYRGDASTVVSLPALALVYRIAFDRAAWGLPTFTVRD